MDGWVGRGCVRGREPCHTTRALRVRPPLLRRSVAPAPPSPGDPRSAMSLSTLSSRAAPPVAAARPRARVARHRRRAPPAAMAVSVESVKETLVNPVVTTVKVSASMTGRACAS